MPCFIALVALLSPRLALFFLLIFTDRIQVAFDQWWVAVLGWFLLPWTTLAWAICYTPIFGVSGFGYFLVALGFLIDISSWFSSRNVRRA